MDVARIYNKEGNYTKTCPNCGAAIESEKCPYCGTVFIDFACIDADKPFFLKVKYGGIVRVANVILKRASLESRQNDMMYFDNAILAMPETTISLDFELLQFFYK